ncbi:MAG TPA: glycine cleavage system aminomethyltransferase GcvT, partial [Clostridia bacterium]|nr:glycine cleavage system aminomethyltransferase GcvT [Clostridia bacterium]
MKEIMKQTPLFKKHMQTASKVINLKGYARPVEYVGHVKEHKATREEVTICDVSHMGEIMITGKDSLALVQKIITNDASKMSIGQAMYSVMCNEKGHIIDDLICFRLAQDEFLWVVNVTKVNEDFQWILQHSQGMEVQVTNISCETALIALQGPNSRETLQKITKADLSTLGYYRLTKTSICTSEMEVPCIISRTGYTGERGYEVCTRRELAPFVWDELLLVGKPLGIVPHGVAARESLRIEAGLLLNGNDMDEATNPYEVSLGKVVKFTKDFIGKDALLKASQEDVKRILVGFEVLSHATVRHGYPIFKDGRQIGKVTSGTVSKNLINRSIGLGFVLREYCEPGTEIQIDLRGKVCQAVIVPLPFYPHQVKVEPSVNTYSPYDLKFSSSHFWVLPGENDVVTIGLSDF